MSPGVLIVLLSTWISKILDDLLVLRELNNSLMTFHVSRGLHLLASKLSEKQRFFACLIASCAWFPARLNCFQMSWSLEEIAFFLIKPLLCILCKNPLVIHTARILLIIFSLRGACFFMQLTNICFHSCLMSFGSEHRSTFDHGISSRSLKILFF